MDWEHEGMSPYHNAVITREFGGLLVRTLEGYITASPGDWIIRGVQGEMYPCKSDIFEATYEEVKG